MENINQQPVNTETTNQTNLTDPNSTNQPKSNSILRSLVKIILMLGLIFILFILFPVISLIVIIIFKLISPDNLPLFAIEGVSQGGSAQILGLFLIVIIWIITTIIIIKLSVRKIYYGSKMALTVLIIVPIITFMIIFIFSGMFALIFVTVQDLTNQL